MEVACILRVTTWKMNFNLCSIEMEVCDAYSGLSLNSLRSIHGSVCDNMLGNWVK